MFESEKDSRFSSLKIYVDKIGLIRVRLKIINRNDTFNFRYPIVLDPKHFLVKRIIQYTHLENKHAGVQTLMNILREKYWILSARRVIRSVVFNCLRCKRHNSKSFRCIEPALPLERVRDAAVFEITGVDFAGPVYLSDGKKAWICLFTCAVYRSISLELTTSLSTAYFIGVLRRFIARRGRPSIVYSDNGSNFIGIDNQFKKLKWQEIKKYSACRQIDWRFNPPSAAWWGGWWERLVRSLKQILRKVIGKASLNYEEMITILCDCEAVLNSRPLTYMSDSGELIPLSPSMFMHNLYEVGVPDLDLIESVDLNRRIKYLQKLRQDLRKRFRSEYLGHLSTTSKIKEICDIKVGDIVLIGDDNIKRIDWPLGRVTETIKGKDNNVRVVKLKTKNGELKRPIQRIYPMEFNATEREKLSFPNLNNQKVVKNIQDKHEKQIKNSKVIIEEIEPKDRKIYNVTRSGRAIKKPERLGINI